MTGARALAASVLFVGCAVDEAPEVRLDFTVVTFNTGTTDGLPHDAPPDDGFTSEHAAWSDAHYGDGLAWGPAIDAAAAFFADRAPEVVGFQEIFWSGDCPAVPNDGPEGFLCDDPPAAGTGEAPSVANLILGPDYQVACHLGKPDKCVAVRKDWGTLVGCDADLCLDGLAGAPVEGCGSGSRVARAFVDVAGALPVTFAHVHGSSGLGDEDASCRAAQFEQVFADLGDGSPAADGGRNVLLGDLNTDPGRYSGIDESAARWNQGLAGGGFAMHTDVGVDAVPTYGGVTNIDHVASDTFVGDCEHPGLGTLGAVYEGVYFDHLPAVCALRTP